MVSISIAWQYRANSIRSRRRASDAVVCRRFRRTATVHKAACSIPGRSGDFCDGGENLKFLFVESSEGILEA